MNRCDDKTKESVNNGRRYCPREDIDQTDGDGDLAPKGLIDHYLVPLMLTPQVPTKLLGTAVLSTML